MKIAVLSSASAGGAGIAAYRIFEALGTHDVHSVDFLDMSILGHASTEVSPHKSATNETITNTHFTTDYASGCRTWLLELLAEYDCLNIHWCSYLLSIAEVLELARLGKKILFTLHDFYYISGGCHYPAGCTGYRQQCIGCPQVNEQLYRHEDVMHALKIKREIFAHPNVHLSAPSHFIVDSAVNAGIIPEERGHVLRNAYNSAITTPAVADSGVFSLLLIADSFLEERKGIELMLNSVNEFCRRNETDNHNFRLHVVGTCEQDIPALLADSKLSLVLHGHVREHTKLVEIFRQCQFMLTCSYEDNWPNILVEAGAYGCIPIVGMGHGCEEFCHAFNTGIVASDYSPEAFAKCLASAKNLAREKRIKSGRALSKRVKAVHSYARVSSRYLSVFSGITNADDALLELVHSSEKAKNELSSFQVSENFLGQATRSLLAEIKLGKISCSAMTLAIEDTPFTAKGLSNSKYITVIFEDLTSKQYEVGHDKNTVVPLKNNNHWASCIIMQNSKSFGLRQIRFQPGKDQSI